MTVHVAIGNSDDRLTQQEWAQYYAQVDSTVRAYADTVYGAWVSPSTSPYQNACWAFEPEPDFDAVLFKRSLWRTAKKWDQWGIAVNESVTEFVGTSTEIPVRP